MYSLKKNKNSVNKFIVSNSKATFSNSDGIYEILNNNEIYKGSLVNYHQNDDFIIIEKNFEGDKQIINGEIVQELNSGIDGIQKIIDTDYIIRTCYSDDYSTSYLTKFNINLKEDIWKINFTEVVFFYVLKNQILLGYADKVSLHNLLDLSMIWIKNYEGFSLTKCIGKFKNELILVVGEHILLSIDVETGETLHKWHELKGFEVGATYKDVLPDTSSFVLDESSAKLIGVFHTYYFEIDLISREITYIQLEKELSGHSIRNLKSVSDNPFTSIHLYLTADITLEEFPNTDLNAVLALNRDTKKVDWVYTFKESGIGTNIPQINDTHLFILDLEGTLHIFEKSTPTVV